MNTMARMLAQRSPLERSILLTLGAVIAIGVVAAFAWLPLERTRARLASELPAMRASIGTLERDAEEAKRLKALPPISQAANAALGDIAANTKLPPGAQVTVLDPKTVTVAAPDVAFGALLEWLSAVQAAQGLRVESARIDALPVAGRVRAELRLTRG
jgi:type II secretory pathway component PulM